MTVNIIRYATDLLPSGTPVSNTYIFDLFKDLSMQDRKYHAYTSDDGHLKGLLVNLDIELAPGEDGIDFTLWGAPNSWALRNAVRRFHFERLEMYKRNGVTEDELGAYAKTIRPYLDDGHYDGRYIDDLKPSGAYWNELTSGNVVSTQMMTGGQWAYSDFISAPGTVTFDVSGVVATPDFTDKWKLSLVGSHMEQSKSDDDDVKWECVSAVRAYIDARSKPVTPRENALGEQDQVIQGKNNPLSQLSSGDISSSAVTEEAESEAIWAPPYELNPDDASLMVSKGIGNVQGSQTKIFRFRNVFLPGGFLLFDSKEYLGLSEMNVEILGVAECREMTL